MAVVHLFQVGTFEQHGLLTLAAVCRHAGHDVHLGSIRSPSGVVDDVHRSGAAVVGIGATTGMHHDVLAAAQAVKEHTAALVVLGGPHATACSSVLNHPAVDAICRGEGEAALLELLDEIDGKRPPGPIANLVRKGEDPASSPVRAPVADLDSLPFVDRDLYHSAFACHGTPLRYFLAGRGCPFSCTYCLGPAMHREFGGPAVRSRSVEHVIGEMREVRDRWGLKSVLIADDIFGLDKEWARAFLDAYREQVALPFSCHLRVGTFDETFCSDLKNAGCWMVSFGVEAGSDRVRREIMGRSISRKDIVAAAHMIKSAGMKLETTNMVGLPTETVEEAFETVDLNRECHPDMVSVSIFQPYPGTVLADLCEARGLVADDYVDRISRTYFESSPLRQSGIDQLVNLHKFFALAVFHPRLERSIRRLIQRRPNRLFTIVFLASHGIRSIKLYGLQGGQLLGAAARWAQFFLTRGRPA